MAHTRFLTEARICLALLGILMTSPNLTKGAGVGSGMFTVVRSSLQEKVADGTVPSICVAVARDGEIIWEEAFGWADKERGVPATPYTPYLLASIAKPITATSVMVLVERAKIDLDGPIQDYLGDLSFSPLGESTAAVTVRHMLNHTSGLPLFFNYFYADEKRRPPTFAETVGRYGVFVEPPGRTFRYANLGYDVLCRAVATASGKAYTDFVRDEVFVPLGLHNCFVGTSGGTGSSVAVRYDTDGRLLRSDDFDLTAGVPTNASVHDLIRFGMFHLKDRLPDQAALLSDGSLDTMHWGKDPDVVYDSDCYGLGWFFREDDCGYRTFWHEGGMSGASAMLKLFPDQDIGVALVMNVFDQPLAQTITNDILDLLLPEYADRRKSSAPRPRSRFTSYKPSEEFNGIWRGVIRTYQGDSPVAMVFEEDGDIHVLTRPFFDNSVVLPGQQHWDAVLNNTGMMGNRIYGWATIAVPTDDTADYPYVVIVDVTREDKVISGAVTATAAADRMYFSLSSYIRLEKD